MSSDFWRKTSVVVLGGGSWGTVLAQLVSRQVGDVRLWVRREEQARAINSTRENAQYVPGMKLSEKIKAMTDLDRVFEGNVQAVIWALPSSASREEAKRLAPCFQGHEILIHATKGVEAGSMKRISQILLEEIPCPRVGVLSGPNLALEIAEGKPAGTVIASRYSEVVRGGIELFHQKGFHVFGETDVVGVEWAGALKNILAIASGLVDVLKLGKNAESMLIAQGLQEMVRFGMALGASESTFLGLAGVGDVLATCTSPLSRNYRVGVQLGEGKKLDEILGKLGSVAEGVKTAQNVWDYAKSRQIPMPITESICRIIQGEMSPQAFIV